MSAGPSYRERLVVPWWWWPLGLAVAVLSAAEVHGGDAGFARSVLPYLVLPALVTGSLGVASRGQLRVQDGVLHVPGARAEVTAFGTPQLLDRRGAQLALGRADAFYAVRPWLSGVVLLPVVDPADDTAFWLLGTSRPGQLVAALAGAARA